MDPLWWVGPSPAWMPSTGASGPSEPSGRGLLRDREVDAVGRQRVLDDHGRGADDAGLHSGRGGHDLQHSGGKWQRTAVDDLADAGDEALTRLDERTADDDDGRIEQADARGEHLADGAPGLADSEGSRDVAAADEVDDVGVGLGDDADLLERLGDRGSAGDGLEAADVAARAEHLGGVGCGDVTEVAGGADGSAVQTAAADDAGADAGCDLDE